MKATLSSESETSSTVQNKKSKILIKIKKDKIKEGPKTIDFDSNLLFFTLELNYLYIENKLKNYSYFTKYFIFIADTVIVRNN